MTRVPLVGLLAALVGVSSPDPRPHAKPRGGGEDRAAVAPPAGWFPLPDKFADPATSGLTLQVGGGPADLDLK